MDKTIKKEREIGPDIIRALAIVCVVCGHFFSVNTPYNHVSSTGWSMLIQGCMKAFFCNLGVPLFLMLSGYFNCYKEFSVQYYKNIKRILIPYLVISVLTWAVLSIDHSVKVLVLGTLGFKTIGYAWFVEMFIGLYLMVPFLNMVIGQVFSSGDKKMLYGLFAVLAFMTSLPPLVDRGQYRLVPDYWMVCFPVLLYVTGAYIRYFRPVIRRKAITVMFISIIYLQYPILNYLKISVLGGGNIPNPFGPYYAIPGYIAMTLLFVLIYQCKIGSPIIKKFVTAVSLASYEMFLLSYLCDRVIYPWFMDRYYIDQASFLVWFFPITVLVLISSYFFAKLYHRCIAAFERKRL